MKKMIIIGTAAMLLFAVAQTMACCGSCPADKVQKQDVQSAMDSAAVTADAVADTEAAVETTDAAMAKVCKPGCTKPCCANKPAVKSCPPNCAKPCCATTKPAAKTCAPGCTKPCCAKPLTEDKKS